MLNPNDLLGYVLEGRYRLVNLLGRGAYGLVFEAEEMLDQEVVGSVAVKILKAEDDCQKELIRKEIFAGNQLSRNSPYLITALVSDRVASEGPLKGAYYLVSSLAETNLENVLERPDPMRPEEVLQVAHDLSNALAALHDLGAVHRDVKPANLLRVDGRWQLADFGLTRSADEPIDPSEPQGTPAYMSPESLQLTIGPPQDVWALGVVLHECCSRRHPYPATNQQQLFARIQAEEPEIDPSLPSPFDEIVRGCLVKDPSKRWTIRDVIGALTGASSVASMPAKTSMTTSISTTAPASPAAGSVVGSSGVTGQVGARSAGPLKRRPRVQVPNSLPEHGLPDNWDKSGILNGKDHSVLVEIPAGQFLYGCRREVRSHEAFLIGKYPVTNAQFALFLDANPGALGACQGWLECSRRWGPRAPAVNIGWELAVDYARWAGLRLLSEAEWERAARSTDGRNFPWGDTWKEDFAIVKSRHPEPVGMLRQGCSVEGVYDLVGNCWEWTSSPAERGSYIIRGGSWSSSLPMQLMAYFRQSLRGTSPNSRVGFRLGKDP